MTFSTKVLHIGPFFNPHITVKLYTMGKPKADKKRKLEEAPAAAPATLFGERKDEDLGGIFSQSVSAALPVLEADERRRSLSLILRPLHLPSLSLLPLLPLLPLRS